MVMKNMVEIVIGANTKNAEQGFDRVAGKTKQVGKNVGGATTGLKGMAGALGAAGIAAMAGMFAFGKINDSLNAMRRTSAVTGVNVGIFGAAVQKNFDELKRGTGIMDNLSWHSTIFGYSIQQGTGAFNTLTRDARNNHIEEVLDRSNNGIIEH